MAKAPSREHRTSPPLLPEAGAIGSGLRSALWKNGPALSAQWEATARVAALPKSPILGVDLPAGKEVAQLLAENHALEAMVERVRKEQVKATYIMQA